MTERYILTGHNFLIDVCLPDGSYRNEPCIMPDPLGRWSMQEAFAALVQMISQRGQRLCCCVYLPGLYTMQQLDDFQTGRQPVPDNARLLFWSLSDYLDDLSGQGWEIDEIRGSVTDAEELGTTLARTMAARRGK